MVTQLVHGQQGVGAVGNNQMRPRFDQSAPAIPRARPGGNDEDGGLVAFGSGEHRESGREDFVVVAHEPIMVPVVGGDEQHFGEDGKFRRDVHLLAEDFLEHFLELVGLGHRKGRMKVSRVVEIGEGEGGGGGLQLGQMQLAGAPGGEVIADLRDEQPARRERA